MRTAALRLNPPARADTASAIVIAVKPQSAPEAMPALAPYVSAVDGGRLDHGRAARCGFSKVHCRPAPRSCAPCRTRPPRSAVASRWRSPIHKSRRRSGNSSIRCSPPSGRSNGSRTKSLMDAVTAVSGSGPAYVFLLAETLAQAGAAAGLPPNLAATLARATVAGSGELLHRSPLDAATLRQNVTSPGRHYRCRAGRADGERWPRSLAGQGRRGGHPALARTRRAERQKPARRPWNRHLGGPRLTSRSISVGASHGPQTRTSFNPSQFSAPCADQRQQIRPRARH